jgi:serine phosphatase RsbU (regulator of sigma subunit)
LLNKHFRRGNREAGILLVPVILNALGIYAQLVVYIMSQIPSLAAKTFVVAEFFFQHTLGRFTVGVGTLSGGLYILSLAIIIVLRSTRMSRLQAVHESEMAAAREVQQIILPDAKQEVPGFSIESAYEPAQQVGGDFFQILPAPEGSLLLVIGDVAGKGLPAAMLVSVLVGAIRGVAEYTAEPEELLANLNQRLVGRVSGGFSTALAARIFPDGLVVLANAGHLAPYLDGHEVEVPGALPLGASAGTRYETIRLQLPRGSRMTFYSDGIVEAQNAEGELFGFERGRALSTEPVAAIVEAAKRFGQEDDITVIAITRDAEAAHEAAPAKQVAMGLPALAG